MVPMDGPLVRHRTAAPPTDEGLFCRASCARHSLALASAYACLMLLGASLVTVDPLIAAAVLTLGPSFTILYAFYKLYECSTSPVQVAYTFAEAILWVAPLFLVAEYIDALNLSLTGMPTELVCSWGHDQGGRALVYALSFSAHCNYSAFLAQSVGHWDDMNCATSFGDVAVPFLGNVSLPVPIKYDGSIAAPYLLAAESISLNMSGGTPCLHLANSLGDTLGGVLVRSIMQGDLQVEAASKASLASAYDLLFNGSARGCPCKKSVHQGAVPEYDYCGPENTCVPSGPELCGQAQGPVPCSAAHPRNITAVFVFTQNTVPNSLVSSYLRAGFLEEALKYVVVRRALFKDLAADSGGLVVYGLAAALGYATVESVEYVLVHGLWVALGRMLFCIPGHCCTGVIIGIHLGYRKFLGKDCRPFCLLGLPKAVAGGCFFFTTLAIPVLLHGTYDFVLMMPSSVPVPPALRVLAALGSTALGFVYCRYAWLQMSNVCVVHVQDLQRAGRISTAKCCCCEDDCRSIRCPMAAPTTQAAAAQTASGGLRPNLRCHPLSGLCVSSHSIGQAVLPEAPDCQTAEHTCPKCLRDVRVHLLYPSDCPFCGFIFPDFEQLHPLDDSAAAAAEVEQY